MVLDFEKSKEVKAFSIAFSALLLLFFSNIVNHEFPFQLLIGKICSSIKNCCQLINGMSLKITFIKKINIKHY